MGNLLTIRKIKKLLISLILINPIIIWIIIGETFSIFTHVFLSFLYIGVYLLSVKKIYSNFFLTFTYVLIFFIFNYFIHILVYNDDFIKYLSSILLSIIIGFFLADDIDILRGSRILIGISLFLMIYIYMYTVEGHSNVINRTAYTALLAPLVLFFYMAQSVNQKSLRVVNLLLLFIIAIISYSRSSLVFMIIILIFNLLYFRNEKTYYFFITVLGFFLVVSFIGIIDVFHLLEIGAFKRLSEKGLESSIRLSIWDYYFNSIDLSVFFIGVDQNQLNEYLNVKIFTWIHGQNFSLHNTFLQAHSIFGITPILFCFYWFFTFYKYFRNLLVENKIYLFYALIFLLGKGSFDVVFFISRYDFLIFASFFIAHKHLHINRLEKK